MTLSATRESLLSERPAAGRSAPVGAHADRTVDPVCMQVRVQGITPGRNPAYDADASMPDPMTDSTRRGNYDSGDDFVLEYGELRFTFNERDFSERCEQAGLKLGFVAGRLSDDELEHVNDCWPELVGPANRSLVHWLRRLIFRSAWLDQRVKEGELDVRYREQSHSFAYVQPDRDGAPVELAPEPSWGRVAYLPRAL